MLTITIPAPEMYNESTEEFIIGKEQTLQLEHSLLSLSKWESKWKVPFFGSQEKTELQVLDYVKCMTVTPNVDQSVYLNLTKNNYDEIEKYISTDMTATTISKNGATGSKEIVTSELIYYWMVALTIPFQCEKWHLSRLMTLIEICSIKNKPPKKMTRQEQLAHNRAANAARRNQLGSTG